MKHLKGLLAVAGDKASPTVLGYAELLHAGGLQVRVQKYDDNEPRSLPRLLFPAPLPSGSPFAYRTLSEAGCRFSEISK